MAANLYNFVSNKETLLTEAFKHPVMKIKPRAANPYPTLEDAYKCVLNAIEYSVIENISADLKPRLDTMLETYILMNGDRDDTSDTAEWESGIDDLVEAEIEEYVPTLSADWLGNNTIGSGVWDKDGVDKFLASMGREVFKQLTFASAKTPLKILAAAGIVQKDVEARLELHNQPQEKNMAQDESNLDAVIQKIAAYVGKDYDILTVYDDLDLASDDDNGLAIGAGSRLGLNETDVSVLQDERLFNGDDTAQKLADMLAEAVKGGKKPADKKPAAKKAEKVEKPAAKKKVKEVDASAEAEGAVKAETLQRLKNACTFKDADIAEALGVSRATFNNWTLGKTSADLNGDQAGVLRDLIVTRANALLECLAELDGTEPQEVF